MRNVRSIAARIITNLQNQRGSLASSLSQFSDHSEFPLLQELCFGTCRWYLTLEFLLESLTDKPLRNKDWDIKNLILIGLYQLRELSIPDHAVVNQTVSGTRQLNKPWAKSLVNGILRNYQRNHERLGRVLDSSEPHIQCSCPEWLFDEIADAWKSETHTILENTNQRPPLTLRVNLSKKKPQEIHTLLSDNKISSKSSKIANTAIYLEKPMAVDEIPGFKEGWLSVQDESSQLVPNLLDIKQGHRVLDACSAPGGKTCAILESECLLTEMVALDLSDARIERSRENLNRLGLKATLIQGDAAQPSEWWDGELFDRILLDAPCSATGVIRRHPDIKVLRRNKDVEKLIKIQAELLSALWQCLKPNGLLLYTTCSILPRENNIQVERFVRRVNNAKYEGIPADWGVECGFGRQLLTGNKDGPDGFFFSLLCKS
jgi:16S rRNA (cytosine967-C5)-methyltransferase